MKKKNVPGLPSRLAAYVLALLLTLTLLAGAGMETALRVLSDRPLHESVALNEQSVDLQLDKVTQRVHMLAQEYFFQPETVLALISREQIAAYNLEIVAWWMGLLTEDPVLEAPEFEVSEIQAAVREDELFRENTPESRRLRIARDEVAYEVGLAIREAALPVRMSLVELAVPMALDKVDVPAVLGMAGKARLALAGVAIVLAALLGAVLRGRSLGLWYGSVASALGLLILAATGACWLLDLPGMIAPLSETLAVQAALLGARLAKLPAAAGVALLALGAAAQAFSLRRSAGKRAAA